MRESNIITSVSLYQAWNDVLVFNGTDVRRSCYRAIDNSLASRFSNYCQSFAIKNDSHLNYIQSLSNANHRKGDYFLLLKFWNGSV